MKKYLIVFSILGVVVGVYVTYQYAHMTDRYFHFVMCDVGQGDGMYIRTPGDIDIVVDGGPDSSILSCLSDHMPFWDRDIDMVFLTHGHSDHVSGLLEILSRYDVQYFVTQDDLGEGDILEALHQALDMSSTEVRLVQAGEKMRVGEVGIQIVWPTREFLDTTDDTLSSFDKNSSSLTILVSYGDVDILLTGDVEEYVVRDVLSAHDVDILKMAHQGSYTGTGEETFSVQRPGLALISVGENSYGHPHESVLQELFDNSIPYMRTDEQGDIEVVSDGRRFWVK